MSKDMLGVAVRKLVTLPATVLGLVCDLLEKLSDPDWVEATKKFLRKENPWPAPEPRDWEVWRTIQLGTHQSSDALIRAMTDKKIGVSDWSKDIMSKAAFTVASEPTELQLVKVSVAELGFPQGATRNDIYERAFMLGLSIVPAEVGPQLRLQYYEDQPSGEYLRMGMEPSTGSGGRLFVFIVGHDCGERWLDAHRGRPDDFWNGHDVWVFAFRK